MTVIGSNHRCLAARFSGNLAVVVFNYFNGAGKALRKRKVSPLQRLTTRNGSSLIPAKFAASSKFCEASSARLASWRRRTRLAFAQEAPIFRGTTQIGSAPEGRG